MFERSGIIEKRLARALGNFRHSSRSSSAKLCSFASLYLFAHSPLLASLTRSAAIARSLAPLFMWECKFWCPRIAQFWIIVQWSEGKRREGALFFFLFFYHFELWSSFQNSSILFICHWNRNSSTLLQLLNQNIALMEKVLLLPTIGQS